MNLLKGQKIDITKNRSMQSAIIRLGWNAENLHIDIDAAAFLLSSEGRCEQDEHLIFYGNPNSQDEAVAYSKLNDTDKEQFTISLNKLTPDTHKIAVALTIHEGEQLGHSFGSVTGLYLRIMDPSNGEQVALFEFGADLNQETAIVIGELYLHKEEWKFNAIGSGFNGGLAALCTNYGIEVADENVEALQENVHEEAVHTPNHPSFTEANTAPESVQPLPRRAALRREILQSYETITIRNSSKLMAKLQWDNPNNDLDLYCFYITASGNINKIYCKRQSSSQSSPYISITGDSAIHATETVTIQETHELKYVLFAAYSTLSDGIGSFKSMRARIVIENEAGQSIIAPLYVNNATASWVAIAKIDFTPSDSMQVSHVETYFADAEQSLKLYSDGTFRME
jgi:stress response protein SCP2